MTLTKDYSAFFSEIKKVTNVDQFSDHFCCWKSSPAAITIRMYEINTVVIKKMNLNYFTFLERKFISKLVDLDRQNRT